MNATRFETITRSRTTNSSRRQVFGGLLGGATALLTSAAVLEAKTKGGKGKEKAKKAKESAKSNGQSQGTGKDTAPGQQPKEGVCHYDAVEVRYTYLVLPQPAADAHRKNHADDVFDIDEAACAALNPTEETLPPVE